MSWGDVSQQDISDMFWKMKKWKLKHESCLEKAQTNLDQVQTILFECLIQFFSDQRGSVKVLLFILTEDMFDYSQKISMKISFIIALFLVALPALTLQAQEQHEQVLDCYAVRLGLPVSYSSIWPSWNSRITRLDAQTQSWIAQWNNGDQWIQVTSAIKRTWIGVVTQGREQGQQWIKSYKVLVSNDGVSWDEVDDGRNFRGNDDWSTHVKHWFQTPVTARAIRIVPTSWKGHISSRFDFIFKC